MSIRTLTFAGLTLASAIASTSTAEAATIEWSTTGYADPAALHAALARADGDPGVVVEEFAARDDGEWILVTDDWIEASQGMTPWVVDWAGRYQDAGRTVDAIGFTPNNRAVLVAGDLLRHSSSDWPLKQTLIDAIRDRQRSGQRITDLAFDPDGTGFALSAGLDSMARSYDRDPLEAMVDADESGRPLLQSHVSPTGAWFTSADNWFAGGDVPAAMRRDARRWLDDGQRPDRVHLNAAGGYVLASNGMWAPEPGDVLDRFEDVGAGLWQEMSDRNIVAVTMGYQSGPDQPVQTRSYGLLEAGTEHAVRRDSRFSVQSISKTLAALVALEAVDDGAFDLDDPVRELADNGPLDQWLAHNATFTGRRLPAEITPADLMAHTAGFPGHHEVGGGSGIDYFDAPFDRPSAFELLFAPTCWLPAFGGCTTQRPDTWLWPTRTVGDYRYTNAGYLALMALIEDTTGVRFESRADELMQRIGMADSSYGIAEPAETVAAHDGSGALQSPAPIYPKLAAEGLYATAADLVRMGRFILDRGVAEDGRRVISAAAMDEMTVDRRPRTNADEYGLGLKLYRTWSNGPIRILGHGGSAYSSQVQALLVMNPSTGEVFTFAISGGDARGLRSRLSWSIDNVLGGNWPNRDY